MAEISSEDRIALQKETRERIKGIMQHEEATGREGLAQHLAYDTENTVEQAAAILKVSPKAEAPAPADDPPADDPPADDPPADPPADDPPADDPPAGEQSQFQRAMDNGQHPNVGGDAPGGGGSAEDQERSQRVAAILGAQSAATGRKFEQAQPAR